MMKKITFALVLSFFAFLQGWSQTIYTVNPNGTADFTKIQDAFDKLNHSTLTNNVIIEMAKGSYDEKLDLVSINTGNYTITIKSKSSTPEDVVLQNSAVASILDYNLHLRNINNIIIKDLTIEGTNNLASYLVRLGDSLGNVSIENLIFKKGNNVSRSREHYGISEYIDFNNLSKDKKCNNLSITNTLYKGVAPFIKLNYGYHIENVDFINNQVENSSVINWYGKHLNIEKCIFKNARIGQVSSHSFKISQNKISSNSGNLLTIYRDTDTFGKGFITNNFFVGPIVIFANENELNIANNSIKIEGSYGCISFDQGIDSVNTYNNIFYSLDNDAYGLYFNDSTTYDINAFNSDFNNYYFPNSQGIWYVFELNQLKEYPLKLSDVKSRSFESKALEVDPLFIADTNLHASNAALKDAGKPLSYITQDIDGETRKGAPDIGADEIQGNINLVAEKVFNIQGVLEAGKRIQLEYEVKNQGTLNINSSWQDELYLSKDNIIDATDIVLKKIDIQLSLKAGKSYQRQESVSLPYLQGGKYYILLKTNKEQKGFENTYADNVVASNELTFQAAKLADLEVTQIITPSSQFSGKSFVFEWTVKNTGVATTPTTWQDAIYAANSIEALNNPKNLTNDSLLIFKIPSPKSLNPNESYTNKTTLDIPLRYSGKIYYRVQSNYNAAFFEIDTTYTNNGKNSVAVNISQSPLPDLVMTSLNTPNTAFSGKKVPINWTVRNQGQQKTFRTNRQIFEKNWLNRVNYNYWIDKIYLSRKPFYNEDEPSQRIIAAYFRPNEELDNGLSYTHTDSISFESCDYGKYYIIGIANQDAYTYELTYSNNFGPLDSIEVIIDPVPDLKPTKLIVTNQASSGQNISIDYIIMNDGFSTKPEIRSKDYFFLSLLDTFNAKESILLGFDQHNDSLEVGKTYNKTVSFDVPYNVFGDYYLYCYTDYTDNVCEANLNNNNVLRSPNKISVKLSPQPDLTPSIVQLPDTLVAGLSYTIITKVNNNGQADADQSNWQDILNINGKTLNTSYRRENLNKGLSYLDTITITIPSSLEEGDFPFRFITDAGNDVLEYGFENNNTALKLVHVKRDLNNVPDLKISKLNIATDGLITSGDVIELEYELSNLSKTTNVNAWEDLVILKNLSEEIVWQKNIKHLGGLSLNETKKFVKIIQLPYTLDGEYEIEYIVNHKPSFTEYILENNVASLNQEIEAYLPPDLEITNITFDQCCQKYALQEDTFLVQIKNNGPGNIQGKTFGISAFLSKDEFGNEPSSFAYVLQAPTISSGSSAIVKVPVKWNYDSEGDYFLIGVVDADEKIYEGAYENNNRFVSGYTINVDNVPIELYPTSINIKSNTNPFSNNFSVDYTVFKGTNKALNRKIDDRLVLSRDKKLSADDIQFGYTWPKERNVAQSTSQYTDNIIGTIPEFLLPGWYFVGLNIDGLNTVLEPNETNNVLFTKDSFYIDNTVSLVLDQSKTLSFYEGTINGSQYFNIDRPKDKGMIVELDFENDQVSSELYHRIGEIPTDAVYDNKYNNPFLADQEILVPVTDTASKDFLFLKANKVPWINNPIDYSCFLSRSRSGGAVYIPSFNCNKPDTVPYHIIAKSAEYGIYKVSPDLGSHHGAISLYVQGFDFEDSSQFLLTNGADTLFPMQVDYMSSTEAAIHVDLREAPLDQYDIVTIKKDGSIARLNNGFTVFNGAPEEPFVNIHANSPQRVLVGQKAQITIDFGNRGYTDGHDYWLWVAFANESFDPSTMHTSYIGSSEEDQYDLFDEHPNPPNDSAFIDFEGLRYYLYWIPLLPAQGQTTFTYNFSSSEEEHVLVQAELVPQPLSDYSTSQYIPLFNKSASFFKLMDVAGQVNFDKLGKKGFDCNNINIKNVEKDILKQTWEMGQRVHGGAKTYAGVNSVRGAFKKAVETHLVSPAKDAVDPKKIKENTIKAAKDKANLKKLINYEKPMTDRFKDYAKSVYEAGSPIENLKKITKPKDPPFKDLINNTFKCIDFDGLQKKYDDCIEEYASGVRERLEDGSIVQPTKKRVRERCREDFGLPSDKKDEDNFLTRFVRSKDPNEIVGPQGISDARLISKDETLQYTIFFENVSTASAPARFVAIDNPLPKGLRAQSFRLTSFGFGDTTFYIKPSNAINTTIALGKKYNHQNLNLVAGFDVISNRALWRFTTIDPQTGNMVISPYDGFLPPNDSTNIGQGFVTYEILLDPSVDNETVIENSADIIFDQNEIIPTNVWSNIVLDAKAHSEVLDLPSESPLSFNVSWESNANESAGIKEIEVFVSQDNKPYELWLKTDNSGSAQFVGKNGSTYRFYSVLTTLDGQVEYAPLQEDAITTVKDTGSSIILISKDNHLLAKVYPNPSQGLFTLENNKDDLLNIRITTLQGQLIDNRTIEKGKHIINLSNHTKAIYFLSISDGETYQVVRLVNQ